MPTLPRPESRAAAAAAASASARDTDVPARRSPWVIGIIVGLAVMVLVNLAFIYVAVSGADDVVPSYQLEPR